MSLATHHQKRADHIPLPLLRLQEHPHPNTQPRRAPRARRAHHARQHVHLADLRRAVEEHRRVLHQRRGDRAREVRRAPAARGERVEDGEGRWRGAGGAAAVGIFECEPVRGGGLGEGEVVPGVEERGERGFLAGFGDHGREDAEGDCGEGGCG